MLLLFYRKFHPWVSEGISDGFEPSREKKEDMMENIYDDCEFSIPESEDDSNSFHILSESHITRQASNQGNDTGSGFEHKLFLIISYQNFS